MIGLYYMRRRIECRNIATIMKLASMKKLIDMVTVIHKANMSIVGMTANIREKKKKDGEKKKKDGEKKKKDGERNMDGNDCC